MFSRVGNNFINFSNIVGMMIKQDRDDFVIIAKDVTGFSFQLEGKYKTEKEAVEFVKIVTEKLK